MLVCIVYGNVTLVSVYVLVKSNKYDGAKKLLVRIPKGPLLKKFDVIDDIDVLVNVLIAIGIVEGYVYGGQLIGQFAYALIVLYPNIPELVNTFVIVLVIVLPIVD